MGVKITPIRNPASYEGVVIGDSIILTTPMALLPSLPHPWLPPSEREVGTTAKPDALRCDAYFVKTLTRGGRSLRYDSL
jgi:hypothetical protein